MEDIGLFNQGLKWLQSKDCYSVARDCCELFEDKIGIFHGAALAVGLLWVCPNLGSSAVLVFTGKTVLFLVRSFVGLGSAALLVIMWSMLFTPHKLDPYRCSMSSICALASHGSGWVAVQCLGYTPGLFIVGLFAILVLWMYANFWITGTLFIVGGYLFSLNHARLVVLMATLYAMYCVKVRVGWLGVFLAINLAFLSNDVLNYLTNGVDNLSEKHSL
ncbi:hypothetical protein Salat_0296500 [Sesamum alatum]|uniref:Uncharacterized protein n=1 Tax=Sesamum alatum TaxID=300844 RepID=A0AAE1Z0A5_9LAMI|nr:hypothetical protein Salat_0296500 [Sesamum alatum]